MSPTRRDLMKASAGAISLAFASIPARAAIPALPATIPPWTPATTAQLGKIRKARCFLSMIGPEPGQNGGIYLDVDGDLDGTWTIWADPFWQDRTLRADGDMAGCVRCSEVTPDALIETLWTEAFRPRPTVLRADPFPGFEAWMRAGDRRRDYLNNWLHDLKRTPHPWRSVEQLNETPFRVAVMDPGEMIDHPGYNAVIVDWGAFYLAELDWSTAYPSGGAPA